MAAHFDEVSWQRAKNWNQPHLLHSRTPSTCPKLLSCSGVMLMRKGAMLSSSSSISGWEVQITMTSLEGSQSNPRKRCMIGPELMRWNLTIPFFYIIYIFIFFVGFKNGFENGEGCKWKDEGDDRHLQHRWSRWSSRCWLADRDLAGGADAGTEAPGGAHQHLQQLQVK